MIKLIENTFNLDATNTEEVHFYRKNLKNNKKTGLSSIPKQIFKQFKKPINEPLSLLINLAFSEGKYPSILSMGKIIPLYKKKMLNRRNQL